MSGQRPCLWTVLHCKQQDFQRFLGVDGEQAAAQRVKESARSARAPSWTATKPRRRAGMSGSGART
jgi:hypothetical protein